MGANSKMYSDNLYSKLDNVEFINWPKYNGQQTLEDVAKNTISEYQLTNSCFVGGSSLGGIIALEIAKILKLKKAILIGSTNDPKLLNKFLKSLGQLADYTPLNLIQLLTGKVNNDLTKMFAESNPSFIKAMCKALHNWQFPIKFDGQICQIHGQIDKIINAPSSNSSIIQGGGHLIAVTHPNDVAEFIKLASH